MRKKRKGEPPPKLSGRKPTGPYYSPWWDQVMSEIISRPGLVGTTLSIEALTEMIPDYPDGRRPKSATTAHRLEPVLELVERGPNGSLGRGAIYKVVGDGRTLLAGDPEVSDEFIAADLNWLNQAVDRMIDDE